MMINDSSALKGLGVGEGVCCVFVWVLVVFFVKRFTTF